MQFMHGVSFEDVLKLVKSGYRNINPNATPKLKAIIN